MVSIAWRYVRTEYRFEVKEAFPILNCKCIDHSLLLHMSGWSVLVITFKINVKKIAFRNKEHTTD